ncbi:MAG: SCO family protein [Acetobacteraceae bacterium]|nr:SCO family protein [Acetobacteraceae bacterium]MBV8524199.1 SCO family protein [Acetobacteraceae bacterium]MBV8588820.1 SCO family protein [Acetobacteraceae bacterium]
MAFAAVLVIAGVATWLFQAHSQASGIGGPFTLIDGLGQQVTDRSFRGRYMLVYFGFTFCPDACPTTLNEVAEALDQLGPKADRVQPIFITLDPDRDTPAVIKQYVGNFSPKLIGLTGTPEQIAAVTKEYRVYRAIHRTGPGPKDYTVDHSSVLYLMGPDGRFIAPIPSESPEALATDIAKYLS